MEETDKWLNHDIYVSQIWHRDKSRLLSTRTALGQGRKKSSLFFLGEWGRRESTEPPGLASLENRKGLLMERHSKDTEWMRLLGIPGWLTICHCTKWHHYNLCSKSPVLVSLDWIVTIAFIALWVFLLSSFILIHKLSWPLLPLG